MIFFIPQEDRPALAGMVIHVTIVGRDNNIIIWDLFGHAQFNVNYCTTI